MDKPLALIEDILGDQGGRRRDARYACAIPGTLTSDRGASSCQIVNLSNGGLSAHSQEKLQKGETVEIASLGQKPGVDNRPLRFQVAWVTKTSQECHARLTLLEPSEGTWMGQELTELSLRARAGLQRRSSLRVATDFSAEILWQGKPYPAQVLDLGSHGARVQSEAPLETDAPLVLTLKATDGLPSVVLHAVVIAVHDQAAGQYGLAFAGFQQGGASELLQHLNRALDVKRR